uniref:Transmembrane protein n=2 Tax=Dunaliella tertiolecta TaxID=3047 RepID=A0A7S3QTJ3_DUNTE|mmetsp:Transcript_7729/g.18860  ORF Transcript_7729/g.18860 Transcript_7729/m.18860 type:complete len:228 (-) Transcript_7729:415-1098(-)
MICSLGRRLATNKPFRHAQQQSPKPMPWPPDFKYQVTRQFACKAALFSRPSSSSNNSNSMSSSNGHDTRETPANTAADSNRNRKFVEQQTAMEQEDVFEQAMSWCLMGIWGAVLLTSLHAVVGFVGHQTFSAGASDVALAAARQQVNRQAVLSAARSAAGGAASRAPPLAASASGVTPMALLLRALAAVCGVLISTVWRGLVATRFAAVRAGYVLFVSLLGSLFHFL